MSNDALCDRLLSEPPVECLFAKRAISCVPGKGVSTCTPESLDGASSGLEGGVGGTSGIMTTPAGLPISDLSGVDFADADDSLSKAARCLRIHILPD